VERLIRKRVSGVLTSPAASNSREEEGGLEVLLWRPDFEPGSAKGMLDHCLDLANAVKTGEELLRLGGVLEGDGSQRGGLLDAR